MHSLPASQSGLGSGLLNTSRLVGGALGLAVLSTLADAQTRSRAALGVAHALTDGFGLAFAVGAALTLLGALLAMLLLRQPAREPSSPRCHFGRRTVRTRTMTRSQPEPALRRVAAGQRCALGVADRPREPLDQLRGRVIARKMHRVHALFEHHLGALSLV
jgi:hypothetical protein